MRGSSEAGHRVSSLSEKLWCSGIRGAAGPEAQPYHYWTRPVGLGLRPDRDVAQPSRLDSITVQRHPGAIGSKLRPAASESVAE